jgi:hypothetical protein
MQMCALTHSLSSALLTILTEQAVEAPGVNLFADEIDYHDQACAYDALACDSALDHHEEALAPQAAPAPPCGARDADEDLAEAPAAGTCRDRRLRSRSTR